MANTIPVETKPPETIPEGLQSTTRKKSKSPVAVSANALFVNATQHRAIRFISFMLEEGRHEITPADFLEEALSRHFMYYQSKRGIEFPPKMLGELLPASAVSGKLPLEE